ncbi:ABC transporter ATP-binding protein [Nocardioides sp. zg-DK7169]|uniref:ABC transporter ATP-binding protein n=1 Tax=Nocardioides sp. zg-DK7169 TaxID=2736600 RepID=UPI0015551ECB|nr:ABC transporter ATP-binding protein [Nocardioides sp. zg-DK7169]NPC97770.1 ABC transporter ATP-binding protein [Nocardioides sp. zg-DK7169]
MTSPDPLLEITGLRLEAGAADAPARLVDGVDLAVAPGEVVGLVGESGSGKSLTMRSVLGLLPSGVRASGGRVGWDGEDLLAASEPRLREVRGGEIGMVYQDPSQALDPLMRVGDHIVETLRLHDPRLSRRAARERAVEALAAVGVPDPARRSRQYPHEFSGGMKQRAMIAVALANRPRLVIADEPTTALDVTIQAQVLDLLRTARDELGTAVVLITHDLGLVAEIADRVAVMYAGSVVEVGPVGELFSDPQHPYTRGLLASRPHLAARGAALPAIAGQPPLPTGRPPGCAFHPRCPLAGDLCVTDAPLLELRGPDHRTACHVPAPEGALR